MTTGRSNKSVADEVSISETVKSHVKSIMSELSGERSHARRDDRDEAWIPERRPSRMSRRGIAPFALVILLIGGSVQAHQSAHRRPELGHDFWGLEDGAPPEIRCLAQSRDGYLWLGGANGLIKFDGVRFERFRPLSGTQLLRTDVSGLFAPPSGGLWVGYRFGGFSYLDRGLVTNYADVGASTGTVQGFAQDREGIVWAATSTGLWRHEHSRWEHVGVDWNAPRSAERIAFDRAGWLWVKSGKTLLFLGAGQRRFEVATDLSAVGFGAAGGFTLDADGFAVTTPSWKPPGGGRDNGPPAFPLLKDHTRQRIDRAGGLWVLFRALAHLWPDGPLDDAVEQARLQKTPRVLTGGPHPWTIAAPGSIRVENLDITAYSDLVDREGNVWLGELRGLHRFYYKPFAQADLGPLIGPIAIAADGNGGVWVGGRESSLFHLQDGNEGPLGPGAWTVNVIYRGADGLLWIGTGSAGLWRETRSERRPGEGLKWAKGHASLRKWTGHEWLQTDLPSELAGWAMQAITDDPRGGVWVSLGRGGVYRFAGGEWTRAGGLKELPAVGVISAFTDSLGRVWFGYADNRLAMLDGDRVRVFGHDEGLRVGNVLTIAGRGPDVWIGGEFGLQRFRQGTLDGIAAVDDEWLRGISGIVERADGDLWLNGLSGVVHIDQAEIARAMSDPAHRVTGERFGMRDGLPGLAAQLRPLPSAVEGADGRIWFAVTNGVVWLDPGQARREVMAPPVTIQSVLANDVPHDLQGPLRFPARTSSVQVGFVAVSLADPEAVRYRYTLEETREGWHEVEAANPVVYRNLRPGRYHFSVDASGTNGAWSNQPAKLEFILLPAFYQTAWFRVLCALGVVGILSLLLFMRLRQATGRVRAQMEARLGERERIARELHDTLLQSFHGVLLHFQAATTLLPGRPDDAKRRIESVMDQADRAITEARDAVQALRAPAGATGDLAQAIRTLGDELAGEDHGTRPASLRVNAEGSPRSLHPLLRDDVYRIASEAVRNAMRHAQAQLIQVDIHYDDRHLRLRIRDDGKGIDAKVLEGRAASGHWGLPGMRERAELIGGTLDVRSGPGSGTEIGLSIPASKAYAVSAIRRRFQSRKAKTEATV